MNIRALALSMFLLLAMCVPLFSDDGSANSDAAQRAAKEFEEWTKRRIEEVGRYTVSLATDNGPVALQYEERPVLKWSNPVRSQHRGVMFVWTHQGRPQLACSVFPFPDPATTTHEFQSLAATSVTIESANGESLTLDPPRLSDVLPDAPLPASSRPLRLTQMRRVAGRFGASVTHPTTTDDKTRLLTQPIYRYPADADVDGALFVLSQGTDPECLVLLEATDDGWQYRIARMTAISLTVRLDDLVIREFQPVWQESDPSYTSVRVSAE